VDHRRNTTLKQRVRQLTPATGPSKNAWRPRANNRFADRRIAQLAEHAAQH
jgi:hypothetical protein